MEAKARTIGELRRSGYRPRTVREEMRENLIQKIQNGEELFPGILGFDETVIPQVENAILSGHDTVFLGERGQAKSRMIRSLVNLLDEEIPIIAGCEIPEDPFRPITKEGRDRVAEFGDRTEISWLPREYRYSEKLATPDITIADLIGEVDPIRVAEGRYLSDELTIHYGLVPRTNRGIFCINELPDLAERIQVGLLNILEERDVQIRGYKIRLPLDVYVVASANPEDYTNRGRIITPLKDRCGSEIRTHYPRTASVEIEIMEQEKADFPTEPYKTTVPSFIKEIVAEISALARRSPDINQRSGVSVRVSISNYENLISNALRRSIRLNEEYSAPRISDLPYIVASTSGKIEMESVDEGREDQVIEKLIQGAVLNVFNRYFTPLELNAMVSKFEEGLVVETSDTMNSKVYVQRLSEMNGVADALKKLGAADNPAMIASGMEFILEGLHLNRKLNKDKMPGKAQYRRPRS